MSTITIPRFDATSEEVADGLRQGLRPRCHVRAGTGINANLVVSCCVVAIRTRVRYGTSSGN